MRQLRASDQDLSRGGTRQRNVTPWLMTLRWPGPALLVALLAAAGGCDRGEGAGEVQSSPDPRRNVLVIDDGFDPTLSDFAGRVAATYSIVCDHSALLQEEPSDGGLPVEGDGGTPDESLAARKATLIAALAVRDTHCRLRAGVEPKPDPLGSIARYRERWNGVILAGKPASTAFSPAELGEIQAAQMGLGRARFHGTATAGLIAHQNPGVRLVLVEELLGTSRSIMDNFTCFRQRDIDDNVALFSDPEVQRAYTDRPTAQLDDDLRALMVRHRIGVMNESFGALSRQALEDLQQAKGCPSVDLRRYLSVIGQLDSARALAHPDPDVLLVKSAGNDHSQIDDAGDHRMCADPGAPRLIVGAYDDSGALTSFTNFGRCVDVVAPGSRIITPLPGGWYLPLSGTSFSAPLTARLVSLDAEPVPYSAGAARAVVLSLRDDRQRIPIQRFPRELLYDPEQRTSQYALRAAGPPVTPELPLYSVRKLEDLLRLLRRRGP